MYDNFGDTDTIPVRDNNPGSNKRRNTTGMTSHVDTKQRQMVSELSREELEDKYLRQNEAFHILKKHGREQEEKIKRLGTKVARLTSDKKKQERGMAYTGQGKGRDIGMEETVEDQQARIRTLEKELADYKQKYMLSKQQYLTLKAQKGGQYGFVGARIDTGVQKTMPPGDPRVQRSMRVAGPPPPAMQQQHGHRTTSPNMKQFGHSLLEETRAENQRLQSVIEQLNEQIMQFEEDNERLRQQMDNREAQFEDDLLKVKQQMGAGQKTAIQENIDTIRLARELKEKSSKLDQLKSQYQNIDEKHQTMKNAHDQMLREIQNLNEQLKYEQNRNLSLENELKSGTTHQRTIIELREQVKDVEREMAVLKEGNEQLVSSAFNLEREREQRQRENALRVQITQLEATLRADVGEKGSVLDRLTEEREAREKMEEEHKELRQQYYEVQQDRDALKDKLRFFSRDGVLDTDEMEEALTIVKTRRQNLQHGVDLDFLQKVDGEKNKDSDKHIRELEANLVETINERDKVREMLIMQYSINKNYETVAAEVTSRMEDMKGDYEEKLQQYAQLLDVRAAHIESLKKQLRDVAYGTRQYPTQRMDELEDEDADSDLDDSISLERGQNLFEIHVKRVLLNNEALKEMSDDEPSVFCTWAFFDFEVNATPVMKGPHPEFKLTTQYTVKVDDFFLHYLQKDKCTLELHQSYGVNYTTIGACQLKMKEILDRSQTRYSNTVQLISTQSGLSLGTVEYWVRLRVPMEQALRLYKERSKALGYLHSEMIGAGQQADTQSLHALDADADARRAIDNVNELSVKVSSCSGLQARRDGVQPSPYCVYKFFDFADHDTAIVTGSNNPQFNDSKTYAVPMTSDVDKYLKQQPLQVYVFDDTDPDEASYLGMAKIPLIPLSHDKPIKGTFELFREDGTKNGTIDTNIKWKYSYIPPRAAQGGDGALHYLPGEEEVLQPPKGRGSSKPPRGPAAASTPKRRPTSQPAEDPDMLQPVQLQSSSAQPPQQQPQPPQQQQQHQQQQQEDEASVISEGTPVPGESDAVSSDYDEDEEEEAGPQPVIEAPRSPHVGDQEDSMDVTLTESGENQNSSKDPAEAEEEEEEIDEEEETETETGAETEDSDLIMGSPKSRPQSQATLHPGDTVTITVNHLTFNEDAPVFADPEVNGLFVEYHFLDAPVNETETPYAIAKPKNPRESINYNFNKVFHVDYENHIKSRQHLAGCLVDDADDEATHIRFTVVAEPENEDGDCKDIGVAFVNIPQILESKKDIEEEDFPVYDMDDTETEIGMMNLSVKCLEALIAVSAEMGAAAQEAH